MDTTAHTPVYDDLAAALLRQRVLIIDDDPQQRLLLRSFFERHGATCDEADGLPAARDALGRRAYGLITMDVCMPEGSGLDGVRELRAMGDNPNSDSPVVVISSLAGDTIRGASLEVGAQVMIHKPVSTELLTWAALSALGRSDLPRPAANTPAGQQVFDAERADGTIALMGDDAAAGEVFLSMVSAYERELDDQLSALRTATEHNHREALRHGAHTLKSRSAMLGLEACRHACARLEQLRGLEDPLDRRSLIDHIENRARLGCQLARAHVRES